jgi:hypothetical protein
LLQLLHSIAQEKILWNVLPTKIFVSKLIRTRLPVELAHNMTTRPLPTAATQRQNALRLRIPTSLSVMRGSRILQLTPGTRTRRTVLRSLTAAALVSCRTTTCEYCSLIPPQDFQLYNTYRAARAPVLMAVRHAFGFPLLGNVRCTPYNSFSRRWFQEKKQAWHPRDLFQKRLGGMGPPRSTPSRRPRLWSSAPAGGAHPLSRTSTLRFVVVRPSTLRSSEVDIPELCELCPQDPHAVRGSLDCAFCNWSQRTASTRSPSCPRSTTSSTRPCSQVSSVFPRVLLCEEGGVSDRIRGHDGNEFLYHHSKRARSALLLIC